MIKEELIPLSSRQQVSLLIAIACIFQFVLFFAPTLADTAVKQALAAPASQIDNAIIGNIVTKSALPDPVAAQLIGSLVTKTPLNQINNASSSTKESQATGSSEISDLNQNNIASSSQKQYKIISSSVRKITAYNSEVAQTDNDPCITANGFDICKHGQEDTIAANFLSFGTRVKIPSLFGDRIFIVRDRMNKKNDGRVDIWMKQKTKALKFGVKIAKIEIVEPIGTN